VNPVVVRIILAVFAAYMIWKTASALKRGTFLTLFGSIDRNNHPRAFRACLAGGYALAVALLLMAMFPGVWLPILSGFSNA
jgi:hypothetical protein